jgi:hypothetical protein
LVAGVMICSVGALEVACAEGEGGTVPGRQCWSSGKSPGPSKDVPGSSPKPEMATSVSSGTSNQASSKPFGEV